MQSTKILSFLTSFSLNLHNILYWYSTYSHNLTLTPILINTLRKLQHAGTDYHTRVPELTIFLCTVCVAYTMLKFFWEQRASKSPPNKNFKYLPQV